MQVFWTATLAYVAMFAFFAALGAFEPGAVLPWTLAAVGLALLWMIHGISVSRRRSGARAADEIRARERRGF